MRAYQLSFLLVVFIASGCGGGSSDPADCRDPDWRCGAPFVCRAADAAPHDFRCLSPVGDIPTCSGSPAGQVVPFSLEPGTGIPLHWTTAGGPVALTYTPDLDTGALDPGALDSYWLLAACVAPFLAPAAVASVPPDPLRTERRIHFQLRALDGGDQAVATVYYELGTGRIVSAVIDIDPDAVDSLRQGDLLHLLGSALGFADAPAGADSIMAPDDTRDTLSPLDIEAYCVLYSAGGSRCGD